ncbi:MAG: outer membrane protein assembly factor BamD [Chromatiales bacterium]|jgi:outer membrane protein assembly factor BamD|nr:outer membrane protein assembly factor BamD [Chromatiales bacterium]MDX9767099.1 outer membrane protein assembly factor BamD [Ectothiorhodospiraceae bacterium]
MRHLIASVALLSLLFTGGCSLFPWGADDPTLDWSASKLYAEAKGALNGGNYEQAIQYYESLEARYPFGRYAQQAQIEIAYAYYRSGEMDSALAAADRFVQLHPQHPHVDYAYYLKGLANFHRGESFLDRIMPRDPSKVDPKPLRQSFQDFAQLVRRFPDSRYAEDATARMLHLRNQLADYELYVADFYMARSAWLAAAQRARYVVDHYQGAESMPKALEILYRAYRRLGMNDQAQDTLRVIETNFPELATRLGAID